MLEHLFETTAHAIFTTGLLATLLGAVWISGNMLAGMMWSISVMILIFVGLFGLGVELFWLTVILTCILLIAGMAVRVL